MLSTARRLWRGRGAARPAAVRGCSSGAWGWLRLSLRRARSPTTTTVVVPRGAGLARHRRACSRDERRHRPSLALRRRCRARAATRTRSRPANTSSPRRSAPRDVADLLASGRVVQHRLTIPEGLTSAEVVALLRKRAGARRHDRPRRRPKGSLLPDTYFYLLGDTRQELIDAHAPRDGARRSPQAWAERAPDLPLTTPARGADPRLDRREGDRARGRAAAHRRRLRQPAALGMRLQSDPTVIYAVTDGGTKPLDRPLAHADLAIDSPYNTYVDQGPAAGADRQSGPRRAARRARIRRRPTISISSPTAAAATSSPRRSPSTTATSPIRRKRGAASRNGAIPAVPPARTL